MLEKLLKAKQVADYLEMHPKTLYKKLRENTIALNFIKLPGRGIAFRPQDVEQYLELHAMQRDGSGVSKPKPKRFRFMTDAEARLFFSGVERDENGALLCSPE